jgi:hypothetical protein
MAVSAAAFLATALLGPSVMEPVLAGVRGQPPYSLVVHPSPYLAIGLVVAGIVCGSLGLGLCLFARPRGVVRALLIAGGVVAAAFMLMPPVGSSDHLNYAAYGRMAATGHNPYVTTANELPHDPVASAVQEWRGTPTVYGPIATAQETLASLIAGRSMRLAVFVMSVTNVLAFIVAGLVLQWAARGDPDRRLKAALLWTANPLLLFELVGGAHNDVIAIAFAVSAVALFGAAGRSRVAVAVAGLVLGLAAAVKLNVAIVGGGAAWALLRRPREGLGRLVAFGGCAAGVLALGYVLAGSHSLDQIHQASKMVSLATPWHLVDVLLGRGSHRGLIQAGSAVLTFGLAALLYRALGRDLSADPTAEPLDESAAAIRMTAALAVAWIFAAPYALPWYDGLGWAMLALLPWTRLDWLLLARTTLLGLAYLPARDPKAAGLPSDLHWLISVVRSSVIPWMLTALLAVLVVVCLRRRGPVQGLAPSPRAPVGSPR